jgi:hypothetical protein
MPVRLLARPYEAWTPILDSIAWLRPDGRVARYRSWSRAEKRELERAVDRVLAGETLGLPVAPPQATDYGPAAMPWTELSPGDAWRCYIAHAAQSLALELRHGSGDWPWSILNDPPDVWRILFDSRETFVVWPDAYGVGWVTPGDPVRTFRFLAGRGLLTPTRRRTIERLLAWCRQNLLHYVGGFTVASAQAHWQYGGSPPVERMIRGTVSSAAPQLGVRHWTLGCYGTSGFLWAVLRTANIAVRQLQRSSHAMPHFVSARAYLAHGDDPYGALTEATPPIPIGEILIGPAKFNAWFGPNVPWNEVDLNIGRRTLELAIEYLPHALLHRHCADLAAGLGHGASAVYDLFRNHYTLAELEAGALWQRLDAKLVELGGCGSVPPIRYGT